jgi:quinol-cytochrome oxidoreductase complex cytochrome b subunit
MAKDEQDNDDNSSMTAYAKYTGLGFQMIVIIGGLAYAGYKIDESANHRVKWVTAILSLAGVFISMYVVIVSLRK